MITTDHLQQTLASDGFVFVRASEAGPLFKAQGPMTDLATFSASWHTLAMDTYMADGGRYRRRRHGHFVAAPGQPISRGPHAAHFQGLDYNPLNGGIQRWFEPIADAIGAGSTMQTILGTCRRLFEAVSTHRRWAIEVHQFRIEPTPGERGLPTPEGSHRDGVDYVLVLLINRVNIVSGTTTIHAPDQRQLGTFTLIDPLDAAFVDDHRVYHGVTAVEPADPTKPSYRDVLVVTFRATGAG